MNTSFFSSSHHYSLRIPQTPSKPPPSLPLPLHLPILALAGRKKPKPPPGRLEGNSSLRREAKQNARKRSRRLAENRFFRHSNPTSPNHPDHFTEEELNMIGLGYDRSVRFLTDPSDPSLRHPHDFFKYGHYGPYSWRGVVVGRPIRGRFSDDRVTLIQEVENHEEWEKIEKFDMANDFGERIRTFDPSVGLRYYWVFVRHPKWGPAETPWEQWTLAAEVALEAGPRKRLDKWSLMARLGNKARALITQCAAWVRPDIVYVKRPVYQCRFEPQDSFFRALGPLLDPETEKSYEFEVKDVSGRVVDICTYFGGLCKIVRIGQKAFVDDVVRAYQKLGDDEKKVCLSFLLKNHPVELLHPYTQEWKAKLEEMELGCDAPDESDGEGGDGEVVDWVELEDGEGDSGEESGLEDEFEDEDENNVVVDVGEETEVEDSSEESKEYWEKQWDEALKNSDAMEKFVKRRVDASDKRRRKVKEEELSKQMEVEPEEDGLEDEAMLIKDEVGMEKVQRQGPKRSVKTSRIPPELFLRAAVRPFTYRNLVKEIVLLRHAIIDGEVDPHG